MKTEGEFQKVSVHFNGMWLLVVPHTFGSNAFLTGLNHKYKMNTSNLPSNFKLNYCHFFGCLASRAQTTGVYGGVSASISEKLHRHNLYDNVIDHIISSKFDLSHFQNMTCQLSQIKSDESDSSHFDTPLPHLMEPSIRLILYTHCA